MRSGDPYQKTPFEASVFNSYARYHEGGGIAAEEAAAKKAAATHLTAL